VKIIAGLGNPGAEYDDTRHNVGWWMADRLAYDWKFGSFDREDGALVAAGQVKDQSVLLVKPTSYMNRSGGALAGVLARRELEQVRLDLDLLVIVDDAAMEVGRVRLRPTGSAGGHNGLASIAAVLGTASFARMRIGVGRPPPGKNLADWVLSPMPAQDEDAVLRLLSGLTEGVEVWIDQGPEAAMNRTNR